MGPEVVTIGLWKLTGLLVVLVAMAATGRAGQAQDLDSGLVGYWPLAGDCQDCSTMGNHGVNHGIALDAGGRDGTAGTAAMFDGRDAHIEVPDSESLHLGAGDFAVSVWVKTHDKLDDVIGSIISKYDPALRKGFNLSINNHAGMTSSQSNYRNVHFGTDDARIEPYWTDCGRPGNNIMIFSMVAHDGDLYVGTCEPGADEAGHLYRYEGGTRWFDCGSPDRSNAVSALAAYRGRLYVGTACYKPTGSALPESPNKTPGGHVYRYEGPGQWTDCGALPEADTTYAMCVYRDELYAIALYHPGVFRWDGTDKWTYCGTPGDQRSMALAVYNGALYSSGNGAAGVWRYEGGTQWRFCGKQRDNTQTYAFAVYEGDMYVGTWPDGSVYRHEGGTDWTNCGRLGEEKEVMGMAIYNGKLYAGTLPLGQVYRYETDGDWTLTGQLDSTADVMYRRVWTMAVYQGRLFAGTLPSGHVLSIEAGKSATYDRELAPGWRHLAAVREGGKLKLYVDGQLVATSSAFSPTDYDISNDRPLQIGFGDHDYFNGSMCQLRIYTRALSDGDVKALYAAE